MWIGLCIAGDTERFIHINDVVSQIGCHHGVYWVVVYNELKKEQHFSVLSKESFIPLQIIIFLKNTKTFFFLESGISVHYNIFYVYL